MNIMSKLFKTKTPDSTAIAAEIENARAEHAAALAKRGAALAGLGTMSDAEHIKAEVEYEAHRRAADRAEARVIELEKAYTGALATEAEAERVAAEQRLRDQVEAARHAVAVDAAQLLHSYEKQAAALASTLASLAAIDAEVNAANEAIRHRSDINSVIGIDATYRQHPDRSVSEQRAVRPCWVYADGTVRECTDFDDRGQPVMPNIGYDRATGARDMPRFEQREIIVARAKHRPGHYEASLVNVVLPAAFAGGAAHWPR